MVILDLIATLDLPVDDLHARHRPPARRNPRIHRSRAAALRAADPARSSGRLPTSNPSSPRTDPIRSIAPPNCGSNAASCARCVRWRARLPAGTSGSPDCAAASRSRAPTRPSSSRDDHARSHEARARWPTGATTTSASYIRAHDVPTHPLHQRGFPSIGCAPCTRAVRARRRPALRPLVVGSARRARMRHPHRRARPRRSHQSRTRLALESRPLPCCCSTIPP